MSRSEESLSRQAPPPALASPPLPSTSPSPTDLSPVPISSSSSDDPSSLALESRAATQTSSPFDNIHNNIIHDSNISSPDSRLVSPPKYNIPLPGEANSTPASAAALADEGYSEHPLATPSLTSILASDPTTSDLLASLQQSAPSVDLQTWFQENLHVLPPSVKQQIIMSLLPTLQTSSVSAISQALEPRLRLDFSHILPTEVCLKIFDYLDAPTLARASRTCRNWFLLSLHDRLWERNYYHEGWQALPAEIAQWEQDINGAHQPPDPGLHNDFGVLLRHHQQQQYQLYQLPQHPFSSSVSSHGDVEMSEAFPSSSSSSSSPSSSFLPRTRSSSSTKIPFSPSPSTRSTFSQQSTLSPNSSSSTSTVTRKETSTPIFTHEMKLALGEMLRKYRASPPEYIDSLIDPTSSRRLPPKKSSSSSSSSSPAPAPPLPPLPVPKMGVLPATTLWRWDPGSRRYRISWKYLYQKRYQLEQNWIRGRFQNIQFPHPAFPEEGHTEGVYTMQHTPDYVVSGSKDNTIRVWNARTQRLVYAPITGHSGSVLCLQFDASPEEDLIISSSSDTTVILWRFSTGQEIKRLKAHSSPVLNVKFDKNVIVTCSKDHMIKVYNRHPLRYGDKGYGPAPENITNTASLSIRRYGYEPNLAEQLPVKPPFTLLAQMDDHEAAVNAIQIHGDEIVSGSGDRVLKIWDWPRKRCRRGLFGHTKGVACLNYDGRRVVSGSSDKTVRIFDCATGVEVATLPGHQDLVRTVQAGFADKPFSVDEDYREARAIDRSYLAAADAGKIPDPNMPVSVQRRFRQQERLPGSRRPQDITCIGAHLPPGGGGGSYARIVSASYDHQTIIWHRDSEGIWRRAHHLLQDKAIEGARLRSYRQTFTEHFLTREMLDWPHLPGSARPLIERFPFLGWIRSEECVVWRPILEAVVRLGADTLKIFLQAQPILFAYHQFLELAIDGLDDAIERACCRQVAVDVATEVLAQLERRDESTWVEVCAYQRRLMEVLEAPNEVGGAVVAPGDREFRARMMQYNISVTLTKALRRMSDTSLLDFIMSRAEVVHALNWRRNVVPLLLQSAAASQQLDRTPPASRVFKLQFDARSLLFCTQAPLLLGWDFSAGDVELAEACRFFAPIC